MSRSFFAEHLSAMLLASLLAPGYSRGDQPRGEEKPAKTSVAFVNVRGDPYRLPGPGKCKAVALIFFGHDCPISNGYVPEILRLHKEFAAKGVDFCIVYADSDLGADDARKHAAEYAFPCPAILDPSMSLALGVGARVKPEAVVLSPGGDVLYLGRIDDRYADYSKRRAKPTHTELRDALEAVLADKPVPTARTKAIGCEIDFPETKKSNWRGGPSGPSSL